MEPKNSKCGKKKTLKLGYLQGVCSVLWVNLDNTRGGIGTTRALQKTNGLKPATCGTGLIILIIQLYGHSQNCNLQQTFRAEEGSLCFL